jgi:hypothetical protein
MGKIETTPATDQAAPRLQHREVIPVGAWRYPIVRLAATIATSRRRSIEAFADLCSINVIAAHLPPLPAHRRHPHAR